MRLAPKNPLFRLFYIYGLQGVAIAVFFEAALLASNIAGLRDLIMGSEQPLLAIALLFAMLVVTFASVSIGAAVISLPYDKKK